MRNFTGMTSVAAVLFMAISANAQDTAPPAAPIIGSWSSACDAWGTPAVCTSDWSRGLHANHVVQTYSIVRQSDQALLFSGRGVYRIAADGIDGYWEDSQGAIHPLAGSYENDTVAVIWGTPATAMGRSEYAVKDGTLTARDFSLSEDGWREFMTVEYTSADQGTE